MAAGIDEIAATLRAARQAKALTQQALGQRVGLPQSHISKIEKGTVDLQLSSLVEIARALDIEVKLVPRKAVLAVESVVRAHGETAETSRALKLLEEYALLAERLKERFPDSPEIEGFQSAVRDIFGQPFDTAHLRTLERALQPARRLETLINAKNGASTLASQLQQIASSLRQWRIDMTQSPHIKGQAQRPAYRLEEDSE